MTDPLKIIADAIEAAYAKRLITDERIAATCARAVLAALAKAGMAPPVWQDIATWDPRSGISQALITGLYPNGRRYVEAAYWDQRGHWSGRKLEPPTHWQPLPAPPDPDQTEGAP